ncbi:hypothetical protein GCM10009616_15380 [Microlunatus lacustris]
MTITSPVSSPSPARSLSPVPPNGPAPLASAALPVWWPIAQRLSHVEPLEQKQCSQLLPPSGRGWVFYPQRPHRVPAAYRVHEEGLLLTAHASAGLVPAPLVLLRIEHLDPDQRFGWTVGVAGALQPRGLSSAADAQGADQPALVLGLANLAGRFVVARSGDAPVPAELDQPSNRPVQHRR